MINAIIFIGIGMYFVILGLFFPDIARKHSPFFFVFIGCFMWFCGWIDYKNTKISNALYRVTNSLIQFIKKMESDRPSVK